MLTKRGFGGQMSLENIWLKDVKRVKKYFNRRLSRSLMDFLSIMMHFPNLFNHLSISVPFLGTLNTGLCNYGRYYIDCTDGIMKKNTAENAAVVYEVL